MRSTRSTGFRLAMRSGLQSKLVCWAPSGRPTARRRGPRPSSGRRLLWRFAPATLPRNFWMLQPVPLKLGQAFARNEGQSRQPVEYALCHAATLSRTIAALVSGTPNRNLKAAYSLERGVVSVVAVASEGKKRPRTGLPSVTGAGRGRPAKCRSGGGSQRVSAQSLQKVMH